MNWENMSILRKEALWMRRKIESIAHDDTLLFNPDFPINACKHASLLYCFHMRIKGFSEPLELVFGVSPMRASEVGHWWVESGNTLIDITADQFNLICDSALSYKIKKKRQYLSVYCCPIQKAPHLKVFNIVSKERWAWNADEISEDVLENLEVLYGRLSGEKFT
ncbi:hypothetical protein [Vibrio cholerae]|uniref:hypothetical protein n=1 Tax=Vibrio cholerae TaxID=666 RepID=UPI00223BBB8F|nr:hypothetical protein [Vibrio cholerae]